MYNNAKMNKTIVKYDSKNLNWAMMVIYYTWCQLVDIAKGCTLRCRNVLCI